MEQKNDVLDPNSNSQSEHDNRFTANDYVEAFRILENEGQIKDYHLRMLQTHYHAPKHTLTSGQMSKAVGYKGLAANGHYGTLGELVGEKIRWKFAEGKDGAKVNVLASFYKPERNWLWIMRPQVVEAIDILGWNDDNQIRLPEEVDEAQAFYEGSVIKIAVNKYERNAAARAQCILHYGCKCSACDTILADVYGEIAQGYIHVHHLVSLAEINEKYKVDPIRDLRPVCPNCHSILHLRKPPMSISELRVLLKK